MNRKSVKIRAILLIGIFLALALVSTSPMILGDSTDGGGGSYYWDSAVAYPSSRFSASSFRTGTTLVRKTSSGYGRVDAHLERDYTAPDDGYITIKIYYQWNWYTDQYYHVYFGTSGLTDPLEQEVSDRLILINPGDFIGPEVSEYQAYTYTYMHVGYVSIYIPVSDGVTYNLQFDLTIVSFSGDEFHLIGSPTSQAIFFVKNIITFYSSIP